MIASVYGFDPYIATVVHGDGFRGQVKVTNTFLTSVIPRILARWMLYDLAGMAAQDRYSHSRHAWLLGGHDDIKQFTDDWYKLHILTEGRCGDAHAFEQLTALAVKQFWYAIRDLASLLEERKTIEGDELVKTLHNLIFTSDFKQPPAIKDVCPLDGDGPFESPDLTDLETRSKALRIAMEGKYARES